MPIGSAHYLIIPFSGWWFVVPAIIAIGFVVATIKWRRHWLAFGSVASIGVAVLMVFGMLSAAGTTYQVAMAKGDRHITGSSGVGIALERHAVWIGAASDKIGTWEPEEHFNLVAAAAFGNPTNHPLIADSSSTIRSSFLRNILGFDLAWRDGIDLVTGTEMHTHIMVIPQWFVLLFCPWLPFIWMRRRLQQKKRIKNGLCLTCGFDLRAHKSGGKCPECGTLISAPAAKPILDAQTPPAA